MAFERWPVEDCFLETKEVRGHDYLPHYSYTWTGNERLRLKGRCCWICTCTILTLHYSHSANGHSPDSVTADARAAWIQERLHQGTTAQKSSDSATSTTDPFSASCFTHLHRIEPTSEVYSNFTRDEYIAAVSRVIEYIRAGDIFQANLSQRLMAPWNGSATQLYSQIRTSNPAPFCGLLKADDFAIVSAAPERFLKVDRAGRVETRPIKGDRLGCLLLDRSATVFTALVGASDSQ